MQLGLLNRARCINHRPASYWGWAYNSPTMLISRSKSVPVLNLQILNGKLTEVQLSLTAKFQLVDSQTGEPLSTLRSVLARRSYQYDIATVNTDNQQEGLLEAELYQEVAGRLARQLHYSAEFTRRAGSTQLKPAQ